MDSKDVKQSFFGYCQQRGWMCATEMYLSCGNADLLVYNPHNASMYEIEIKVSKSDLKADFMKKERKHRYYKKPVTLYKRIPDFMYFLVPESLVDYAKCILKEYPKYGIMAIREGDGEVYSFYRSDLLFQNIEVVKRAVRLFDNDEYRSKRNHELIQKMAKRLFDTILFHKRIM